MENHKIIIGNKEGTNKEKRFFGKKRWWDDAAFPLFSAPQSAALFLSSSNLCTGSTPKPPSSSYPLASFRQTRLGFHRALKRKNHPKNLETVLTFFGFTTLLFLDCDMKFITYGGGWVVFLGNSSPTAHIIHQFGPLTLFLPSSPPLTTLSRKRVFSLV